MRVAALIAVLVAARAEADPQRVSVLAGIGVRDSSGPGAWLGPSNPHEPAPHPALLISVTTPISPHLLIGLHLDIEKTIYDDGTRDCWNLISADVAGELQYADPRFTVGAWLGRHVSRLNTIGIDDCYGGGDPYGPRWSDNFASYGATASFDVLRRGSHALALFADLQTGTGHGAFPGFDRVDTFNFSAITIGAAYRR